MKAGRGSGVNISVVGLGQMGTAIAERLLEAGHDMGIWNRTPGRAAALVERGAQELKSVAEVWAEADLCVTMVADSPALLAVATSAGGVAMADAGRDKLLIDMSTVSPAASAEVAGAAAEHGIRFLRAPVSGNPSVVRAGGLTMVVSGRQEDCDAADHVLRAIGPNVFFVGPDETARVVKLALNLMIGGTAQLLAECVALTQAHGIDRELVLDVVGGSAAGSPFVKYKTAPLIKEDYASTFSARLMHKDLTMALASGADGGVPLPVTANVHQLLQSCISTGFGDLDFMALLPRLQREAGLRVDA